MLSVRIEDKEINGTAVLFLGSKGPGLQFAQNLATFLEERDDLSILITASKQVNYRNKVKHLNLKIPHKMRELKLFVILPIQLIKFANKILRLRPKVLVVTMASPTDLLFTKLSKIFRVKILFVIHDLESHAGDIWPSKSAIKTRIHNSDYVCFLSEFVHSKYLELCSSNPTLYKPNKVIEHPVLLNEDYSISKTLECGEPFLLIIGRIREYKGINEFVEKWVERTSLLEYNLAIVGEGKLNAHIFKERERRRDLFIDNRWLDDDEFQAYLRKASVVVFPYLEATQSGVIPIVLALRKKVVIFDVGALKEQLSHYGKTLVIGDSRSSLDIMKEIEEFARLESEVFQCDCSKYPLTFEQFSEEIWSVVVELKNGSKA